MTTPACPVCGRWNDPTGGPDAHSGGCPQAGKPYAGAEPLKWDVQSLIERIKEEIIEDALDGTVPATVRDYSELHDFVDANGYGGLFDDDCPLGVGSQEDVDVINAATDAVSGWLHRQGLIYALRDLHRDKPESLTPHHQIFHARRSGR